MVKVSTILENGTSLAFEVRSESSCGVHTILKKLGPQEKFALERCSNDTYLQHWVVMGTAHVISFSSDELVDFDWIKIVNEGSEYKKVMNPRMWKSSSLPTPRPSLSSPLEPHGVGEEGVACKPSLRKSFKKLFNSTVRRSLDSPTADMVTAPNLHVPNRLHSI